MRLTTITTCNNYNKVYLRIPKIYNQKFINLTITEPCAVIPVQYLSLLLLIVTPSLQVTPANVRLVPRVVSFSREFQRYQSSYDYIQVVTFNFYR